MNPAEQLNAAFQHTLSADEQQRKQAEAQLKQAEVLPGFLVTLVQFLVLPQVSNEVRQAAAIYLKNASRGRWKPLDGKPSPYSEGDKNAVKEIIIDALVQSPEKIRPQLTSAIYNIAQTDFPDNWPSLLSKVSSLISSQNPASIEAGLLALLMAFKKYEFTQSDENKRDPLYAIVASVFPALLQMWQALYTNDSVEAARVLIVIAKIVRVTTYLGVAPFMIQGDHGSHWLNVFVETLDRPVPAAGQSNDQENLSPHWRLKKWLTRLFERFIKRYGKIRTVDPEANQAFGRILIDKHLVRIQQSCLNICAMKRSGAWMADRVLQNAISFLGVSLKYGSAYTAIKPHLDILVREVLFPLLVVTDEDLELLKDDPHEYLKKKFDPLVEYYSPSYAAKTFIIDLVSLRGKGPLTALMTFIVGLLTNYNQTPPQQRNPRIKDGCLSVIAHLSHFLKRIPEYMTNLEAMLWVHVFPEFGSPHGFLRAQACYVFSQFYNASFTNKEHFQQAVLQVMAMMKDPELPVKIQAAFAFRYLLNNKDARVVVKPRIEQLLQDVFGLMNEIDNEDLVSTLEKLIEKFGEAMAPYALALCTRLTETFMRLFNADEDEDSQTMAAMECLTAIRTLLHALHKMPEIFPSLEQPIMPLLTRCISSEGLEFIEDMCEILTWLSYFIPTISDQLWTIFPQIYNAFMDYATDLIEHFVPPLDNYISHANDRFLSDPRYLEMIFNMYKKAVGDHKIHDFDSADGCRLMESVLHNCKGRVDHIIPEMLSIALTRLTTPKACKEKALKMMLIEVFANSLYYNPALTLQWLESTGATQVVFTTWFNTVPKFKKYYDKKLLVLGLSSILLIRSSSLPPLVLAGSKNILDVLLKLIFETEARRTAVELEEEESAKLAAEAEAKGEKKPEENGGDDDDDMDDDDSEDGVTVDLPEIPDNQDCADELGGSDDEDEDDQIDALSHTIKDYETNGTIYEFDAIDDEAVKAELEAVAGKNAEAEEDDDEEEEEDYESEDDSDDDLESEYTTPVDKVDELVFFTTALRGMYQNEPQFYEGLFNAITAEQRKFLQDMIQIGQHREANPKPEKK